MGITHLLASHICLFIGEDIRQFWLKVHLYIALSVGFVFVILGITGSFNVFYFELEELGLPDVHKEAKMPPLSLSVIMKNVKTAHPQRQGSWNIYLPGYNHNYVWATYSKPEETINEFFAPLEILIDPYTGKIVKEQFWGHTLWSQIYQLHVTLLMAKVDSSLAKITMKLITFLGIFFFISILIGLYLWWPKPSKFIQAVTFKRGTSSQRLNFDLHKVTGFYSSIILLIIAFSGFAFGYSNYIKSVISYFSEVKAEQFNTPELVKSEIKEHGKIISIEHAVSISDKIFPNAKLRWLATPEGKEGVYVVEKRQVGELNHRRPRSKVWIDQYSGKVLAAEDPNKFTAGETFLNLQRPLHSGEAFGFAGRIIWCIAGFAPLVLYVTGIIRWQQKRKAKQFKERK